MPETRPRHLPLALAVLAFAQLIIALDYNIVFVALPDIGDELGFSEQTLQWVVSGYAVAFGGFLLLGGRVADLFGRRSVFVTALALYAGASVVGGLAVGPGMMIAARAVQGVGGALLFPVTLALVNTLFTEGPERNRALAVWGGAGASGLTLGSLLGGVLTGWLGWSSVFFVNVPLAALVIAGGLYAIPRDARARERRGFDLPGALTATAGVTLLVYALVQGPASGWTSPGILTAAALAVLLLAAFALVESRTSDPLMPLRLLRNRSLAAAMAITFVFQATFSVVPYFLTILWQQVQGMSALKTGLAFLVPALAIAAGTQIGERLVSRRGARTALLAGFVPGALGTALTAAAVSADSGYWVLVPGLVVGGVGQGIVWTGMWIAAATGVAAEQQGVASGMASTAMQVGGAVGLAVFVAIANSGTGGLTGARLDDAVADGQRTALYLAAAGILLGALLSLVFRRANAAGERIVGGNLEAGAPDEAAARTGVGG
ncbi:MFS transporter [Yinghuangia seranimata]|uniref:MFS transporter n=1 Tax=Yinghuangia seranimata TaxID=408067 RepID=UPI00248BBABE|nr:MFS transporter [Yinghuangia seranimata]MDI2132940.1 MFS transporter [Yinghuangia seranimata]